MECQDHTHGQQVLQGGGNTRSVYSKEIVLIILLQLGVVALHTKY